MSDLRYKVILSVLGIATVIVSMIGFTFAYYVSEASLIGSGASTSSITAKIGNVSLGEEGTSFIDAPEITPGWDETKTLTVTSTASDLSQEIDIVLNYTNTMPDLTLHIEQVGAGNENVTVTDQSIGVHEEETSLNLVHIKFPKSSSTTTYTFNVTMALPLTDQNQNANQDKRFEGTISAIYNKISEE